MRAALQAWTRKRCQALGPPLWLAEGIGAAAIGILVLAGAPCAWAQGIGGPGGLGMGGSPPSFGKEQLQRSEKQAAPPPAALPGATSSQEAIAPPTNVPTMMNPNDELFDAINRGDIATARDALSRGADLNARNELDQTPLDLSVDLGRNAITFLLLSMQSGGTEADTQTASQNQPAPPAKEARLVKQQARGSHAVRRAFVSAGPDSQTTLPQLFAGNGGRPIPGAGFLGFDGH